MLVPINQLPSSSKVWIYQSTRKFSDMEEESVSMALKAFVSGWEVHGQPLPASFEIRFNQFIVIAADDSASGCSIDTSVRTLREIGTALNIDLLDRSQVAFNHNDKVELIPLAELKTALIQGRWSGSSLLFNNAVATLGDYRSSWLQESGKTWLKRYFLGETFANKTV